MTLPVPYQKGKYLKLFPGMVMVYADPATLTKVMFHFGQQQAFEGWLFRDCNAGHGQRKERSQFRPFLSN